MAEKERKTKGKSRPPLAKCTLRSQEMIQSYIFTTASYDCKIYEKRIIYRLILKLQEELEGKRLTSDLHIEKTKDDDRVVTIRISEFLFDGEHATDRIKAALLSLRNKFFICDNGKIWKIVGLIEKPNFGYKRGWVRFEIQPEVYRVLLDFSKGFRKFDIAVAMKMKSPYSMRLYELMSGQKDPLEFRITELKKMFMLSDKYSNNSDFIRRVIAPAQKELDAKSPVSFRFRVKKTGVRIFSLVFIPIVYPERQNPVLCERNLISRVSLMWDFSREERKVLYEIGFSDREIRNNYNLFRKAKSVVDLYQTLLSIKHRSLMALNPQGYVINTLKHIISDIEAKGE